MSNFYCETCGAAVIDSPAGYVEGCEHYPPDVKNNDAKPDIEILAQAREGEMTVFDYTKIDNAWVEGIDTRDYPDLCDAYIESADYDGTPMTEDQLDKLNEDLDYVYECALNQLF